MTGAVEVNPLALLFSIIRLVVTPVFGPKVSLMLTPRNNQTAGSRIVPSCFSKCAGLHAADVASLHCGQFHQHQSGYNQRRRRDPHEV